MHPSNMLETADWPIVADPALCIDFHRGPSMLTLAQRRYLEQRLRSERQRALRYLNTGLARQLSEAPGARSGDLTGMPTHQADLGTETMQEELDASNLSRVSQEVAEIDDALSRLIRTPEKFGLDERTGDPIPLARLDVIPWARTRVTRE